MPSGVASAAFWKLSYMLAQLVALFGDGAEPPPESSEPRRNWVIWALETALRSAWVIWPSFSSRLIRPSRSLTRVATGRLGSWYGKGAARAADGANTPTAATAASTATTATVLVRSRENPGTTLRMRSPSIRRGTAFAWLDTAL